MPLDRRFPLNSLRAFEAVGRHGHLRRAAEELNLTHAALSHQVRLLESELGCALFSRAHNGMQLTTAGRRFHDVVQTALDALAEGVVHLDPAALAGELVIATTPTISINWLPGVIHAYSRRYPEVELHCATIEPHQRNLPARFDLALCLGAPEPRGKVIGKLYQEYYFPVCAPELVSAEKPVQQPRDLLAHTLLHERFQHWEEWFATHGIDRARGQGNIHFDYGFQSIEAARQGLGIVLADRLEVAADLRRGTLVRLLEQEMAVDEGIYLVAEPEASRTVRAQLFIDELQRYLRELGVAPA
ncbi:MAG: LysR substrate-binding domain-containing protein [Haliea sp.]|uniref:LysR substrate-binding domain-containing protein n=1 Tax=Haliea sp. TaxID=1932666 RepID=UPI0032EEEB36